MPITIPADTHIPGDPGHTTDHNNIADVLTAVCPPYQFWVSKYGALGNGFTLENCANITSGLNVLTRTDGGAFTAGDVGKNIVVNYAGATATTPLSTTISGFTNSTTVTLTANAGRTVTGGDAMYGTDDTAAIQAAINAAVAYAGALAGNCYGEVVFNQGIYVLGSPTVKVASPVFSNSQVNFSSVVAVAAQKLTIKLRGANPSPFAHWNQAVPQVPAGTVLFSTLLGQTFDATFGDPSVIGGPNPTQGYGSGALLFNNMMPVVENITVMCPFNPSVIAYDFRGMAEAWLPNASSSAFATPAEMNTTAPSNSGGVGLYMPSWGNNDRCDVGSFGCEGFYYGVAFGEHFNAQRLGLIYTNTGIFVNTDSVTRHGSFIGYASVEVCTHVIQANPSATTAAQFPLVIARLDTEFFVTDIINDTNSILYGHVSWGGKSGDAVAVTGAKNIELINDQQARGTVTPPSVPATTVAITNPFWRHAAVTIKGGTGAVSAVAIDGTSQGITLASTVTTTVIVPSGKTIALTYAATGPTWTWILL